jgi:hypothetical protein
VSTPGRFDFTLRTAQRRVEVGDVLLQLNATTLSHLPRRAVSVTKLARLGPALLTELAESRVIHRGLSVSEVDAIVEKYLGAPEPKTANLLALIEKAEQITRETHGEWTPAKFQCVARVLAEFAELVETLCRQHESKSVSLARAEEPHTDQPSAAKFYEHEPNHHHSRSPALHCSMVLQ